MWDVIKNLPSNKAPGPHGFTGRFYKVCWLIIKNDVMAAIGAVHGGDVRMLHLLNSAYMVLIPEKEDATRVTDYRPIRLVHSFGKLITKILANHIAPCLGSMVASNYSAFIRGRCIQDNFILVQHLARFMQPDVHLIDNVSFSMGS